jgi:hypothetical protein
MKGHAGGELRIMVLSLVSLPIWMWIETAVIRKAIEQAK